MAVSLCGTPVSGSAGGGGGGRGQGAGGGGRGGGRGACMYRGEMGRIKFLIL